MMWKSGTNYMARTNICVGYGQNESISLQEVIDMSQDKADNLGWGYGVGHIKKMWQKDLDNRPFFEKQAEKQEKRRCSGVHASQIICCWWGNVGLLELPKRSWHGRRATFGDRKMKIWAPKLKRYIIFGDHHFQYSIMVHEHTESIHTCIHEVLNICIILYIYNTYTYIHKSHDISHILHVCWQSLIKEPAEPLQHRKIGARNIVSRPWRSLAVNLGHLHQTPGEWKTLGRLGAHRYWLMKS